MTLELSGASRIYYIVGDPIAQVKSPNGVSRSLQAMGADALVIPAHVAPDQLQAWFRGVQLAQNVDGVIVTIPHKFAAAGLCSSLSERSQFLGAVNVLRRRPDGGWHGDMVDGLGFTQALIAKGAQVKGAHALLVGAGGAGSAIAHALLEKGLAQLSVHDEDLHRRDSLIQRLRGQGFVVNIGSATPQDCQIIVNATPIGMRATDPLPVQTESFAAHIAVGCAITVPALTPLILLAQSKGCLTVSGSEMFSCVRDLMINFLMFKDSA